MTRDQHESFREWLSLEADGGLTPTERARLGEHLRTCEECRAEHAGGQEPFAVAGIARPRDHDLELPGLIATACFAGYRPCSAADQPALQAPGERAFRFEVHFGGGFMGVSPPRPPSLQKCSQWDLLSLRDRIRKSVGFIFKTSSVAALTGRAMG